MFIYGQLSRDRRSFNLPPRAVLAPAQRVQQTWPQAVRLAVSVMAELRTDADRGLGDTAARLLGGTGVAFKAWFQMAFKRSCGCTARQQWLNERFPYPLPWEHEEQSRSCGVGQGY